MRHARVKVDGTGCYHVVSRIVDRAFKLDDGEKEIFRRMMRKAEVAAYIHLNPVRVKTLGLGKEERKREKAGLLPKEATREQVQARLAKLRSHRWSSYPAYAGYTAKPGWLTCERLWRGAGTGKGKEDGKADCRLYLEGCLRLGVEEGAFAQITSAVVIGGAAFVEGLRRKVPPSARCDTNARAWRRLLPFGEVVKAVEAAKGESGVKWLWRNVRRRGLNFFSSDRRGLLNF